MTQGAPVPQINVSKIQGSGGVAGAMVAVISTLIFLVGIPALRYFLPAAIVLGGVDRLRSAFWYSSSARPDVLCRPTHGS